MKRFISSSLKVVKSTLKETPFVNESKSGQKLAYKYWYQELAIRYQELARKQENLRFKLGATN